MDYAQAHTGADKTEWRSRMAEARDSLQPAVRGRNSERLCRMVEAGVLAPLRGAALRPLTVCLYAAFRSEADPALLLERCLHAGDRIVAPRMAEGPGGKALELCVIDSASDFVAGKWGVPEPDPNRTAIYADTEPLDIVLVPGLAFDRFGGRLGYGGGFYDRLYAAEASGIRSGPKTIWIGFAYSLQLIEERLPIEPHDLKMDGLATEKELLWHADGMGDLNEGT